MNLARSGFALERSDPRSKTNGRVTVVLSNDQSVINGSKSHPLLVAKTRLASIVKVACVGDDEAKTSEMRYSAHFQVSLLT